MKKIVCPSCGKVNFEAFVTYPHCAECGALLPDAKEPAPRSFWRRPVGTLWWISLLGVAAVVLAISVTLLGSSHTDSDQLLIYGSLQRRMHVGSQTVMQLTLDTVEEASMLKRPSLEEVEVRIPTSLLKSWTLVSMEPVPKKMYTRGGGTYFRLGNMAVGNTLFLTWRALKPGEFRFVINVFADNHDPVRYIALTQVDHEQMPTVKPARHALH